MGAYWSQFTDDQKELITDTFCKLSIATYAGRFNQFDDDGRTAQTFDHFARFIRLMRKNRAGQADAAFREKLQAA